MKCGLAEYATCLFMLCLFVCTNTWRNQSMKIDDQRSKSINQYQVIIAN